MFNKAKWIKELRRDGRHAGNIPISDAMLIVGMVLDGDLRHVDDEDFRREIIAANTEAMT